MPVTYGLSTASAVAGALGADIGDGLGPALERRAEELARFHLVVFLEVAGDLDRGRDVAALALLAVEAAGDDAVLHRHVAARAVLADDRLGLDQLLDRGLGDAGLFRFAALAVGGAADHPLAGFQLGHGGRGGLARRAGGRSRLAAASAQRDEGDGGADSKTSLEQGVHGII